MQKKSCENVNKIVKIHNFFFSNENLPNQIIQVKVMGQNEKLDNIW